MSGVNKVIVIGHLGKDPEVRTTGAGTSVCNFSVATSEKFKDKDGNQQERTEWFSVVTWAKLAEICGEWLHKGKQVYLEGRMQTRTWDNDQGVTQYKTELVANQMVMLGGGGDPPGSKQAAAAPSAPADDDDSLPF